MAFGDAGRAFGYAVRTHKISGTVLGLVLTLALLGSLLPKGAAGAATTGPPAILIPSSGAYLGARVGQRGSETLLQAIQRVESQIGRQFAIDHFYYQWSSTFPNSNVSASVSQGRIPLINWKSGASWSAIASGQQDATIITHADALKSAGYPVYLAYHHEPEDDLDTYGSPTEYAAAFRRVVEVFRSRGVTNVAFVWNMMGWTFDPRSGRNPNEFYPGDAYVDIVGADGYNWYPDKAGSTWSLFRDIFKETNDFAVAHGKPWMIAEYGCQEDPAVPGRKGDWFRDALATAKTWPSLKAMIYFDQDKDEDGLYKWMTDTSSSSMSAYREIANDPFFKPSTRSGAQPPPSPAPTQSPSPAPTQSPSPAPTQSPSPAPTQSPTQSPSPSPTQAPAPAPIGTLTNNLNGGARGISLSGSTSGGVSGSSFDGVAIEGGASLVYDTAHTRGPGLSARHSVGPRQNAFYRWENSFTSWHNYYGRVYVWFDRLPTGDLRLVRGKDASELSFAIDLLKSGQLRGKDRSNRTIVRTWTPIITGGWVRIEWRVDLVTGTLDLRLFNSPNSLTPTDSATSGPGRPFLPTTNQVQIGRSGTQPFSAEFWTDDPAISGIGWLGPAS